jgi:hypothetical protein
MKTYSIALLIAALALGGCSTAYQAGQTPDAVYAPAEGNVNTASSANSDNERIASANDDSDDGQYVTYDNSDYNTGYADDYDGYYTQRIRMFDSPGSFYAGSYYMGSPYSMSLGWSPLMWSPGMSLALTLGSPWGGWYSPWYAYGPYAYSPFYSYYPYYPAYYGGYGYYGGGFGGKYIIANPRPAASYGPRGSVNSRAGVRSTNTVNAGERVGTSAPRRVFTNGNTNGNIRASNPRRVFTSSPDEHPVNVNTNTRTTVERQPRRLFRSNNTNRSNVISRPTETNRPVRTFENNAPQRSMSTFSNSSESNSAPVRISSPRRR